MKRLTLQAGANHDTPRLSMAYPLNLKFLFTSFRRRAAVKSGKQSSTFLSANRRLAVGNQETTEPRPLPRTQSTRPGIQLMKSMSASAGHAYQYRGLRKVLRETVDDISLC